MKKEKSKEAILTEKIPQKRIDQLIKKVQSGKCVKKDIYRLLNEVFNVPQVFIENAIDPPKKHQISRERNSAAHILADLICVHCNLNNKEVNKFRSKIKAVLRNPDYIDLSEQILECWDKTGEVLLDRKREEELSRKINEQFQTIPFLSFGDKNCPFKPGWRTVGIESFYEESAVRLTGMDKRQEIRTREGNLICYDYSPGLRDGKYLSMEVDLTQKKEKIIADIQDAVDRFIKHVERKPSREKETILDPWTIYDMHHEEGLSFSQIAKRVSGINENVFDNATFVSIYKQVERAYSKACKLIAAAKKIHPKKPSPNKV